MTDEQMKKLLEEDTGEVPERFHQAMLAAFGQMEDEPFDGTELPISVEAAEKPRRPRHVPRQGGRFRRMMLVMLITLGLLGAGSPGLTVILTPAGTMVCAMVGIMALALSRLVADAAALQDENDLTV